MMRTNGPLVTIAIPIYNAEEYLEYAIQSVVNQTYKDWILLLINDGSTDKSLDIMMDFSSRYDNVKVVNDNQNRGLVYRLNESIALTSTKYYARMDADDIMAKSRIETQILYLESHEDIDVLGSSAMLIDNNNIITGSWLSQGKVEKFIHPTVIGKTQWFKKNQYTSWAVRAEDSELWIRTASKSNFYSLEQPLLFYREYGVPALNKTIKSLKTMIKIYSRYSIYGHSFLWGSINILVTFFKIIIYLFFSKIGKMDYILKKRVRNKVFIDDVMTEQDLLASVSKKM